VRERELCGRKAIILAGLNYRRGLITPLLDYYGEVEVPMEGLMLGQQLSWLSRRYRDACCWGRKFRLHAASLARVTVRDLKKVRLRSFLVFLFSRQAIAHGLFLCKPLVELGCWGQTDQ